MFHRSLIHFVCPIGPLANQITMDLPHVVHYGRSNQHHTHAGLAPHRHFTMSERVFGSPHGCFYSSPVVARPFTRGGTLLSAPGTIDVLLREAQYTFAAVNNDLKSPLINGLKSPLIIG